MFVLEAALAGLIGLLIGSFLNVCIYRMPRDLSVVHPRSFCPHCEKQIGWYDNIPVLTFLMLRGRCRHCGAAISWRYPIVELLTGVLFFVGVYPNGFTGTAIKFCILAAILVALIFTDFEERILPDEFTKGGIAIGLLLSLFVPVPPSLASFFIPFQWGRMSASFAESLLGAVFPSTILWAFGAMYEKVRHREGLGLGDVKMVAMIGAFFGLSGALFTLMVGSILGSVIGLGFILMARKQAATYELPFGTFLGIAALAIACYMGPIAAWSGRTPG